MTSFDIADIKRQVKNAMLEALYDPNNTGEICIFNHPLLPKAKLVMNVGYLYNKPNLLKPLADKPAEPKRIIHYVC